MSASETQLVEATPEASVECQSENRLPENSISSVAKTQPPALPHPVAKPQVPLLFKLQQQQQPKQYVINSVAMHVKATTAGVISGGTLHRVKSAQKLYAKAIYDNYADTPDELPFKKGDILTVIEQDTEGIQGWWLCSLRNRQGLCPGNRLRILNSYDSGCFSPSPASSPIPSLAASTATLNSSVCSADIYENGSISGASSARGAITGLGTESSASQGRGSRKSWHVSPHKVITPQRYGDVYEYNCPQGTGGLGPSAGSRSPHQQIYSNQRIYQNLSIMASNPNGSEFETYDIPKPATPVTLTHPRTPTSGSCSSSLGTRFESLKSVTASIEEESYDVPRPLSHQQQPLSHMTPSSSSSSLLTSDSLSLSFSNSNRSSLANMPDYDIPRRNPMPVRRPAYDVSLPPLQEQEQRMGVPASIPASIVAKSPKELPLELSSALETLARLQAQTTAAITRLLSFVVPNWRNRANLEPAVMELKLAALRLRTALHDLAEFGEGALGNATRSEDRGLALKLRPLVRALRDANKLIHDSSEALDAQGGWSVDLLARSDEKHGCRPPDALDQLMACAQTLTEDVRSTTSFIQGNASLLFKRQLPAEHNGGTPNPAEGGQCSAEWLEDYDYVSFESKDAAARKNQALREAIPASLKTQFDTVIRSAESAAMGVGSGASSGSGANPLSAELATTPCKSPEMTDKDKKLVRYYAQQISTHMGNLMQAIDSFLETVEKNQPPKFFIAYGKFVVVSAHNLVTIGDNVHRNISKEALRDKILRCTNGLSEALKTCVSKSKRAAAHFPSGSAVQEMVDSVLQINSLARELKTVMLQAVHLSAVVGVGA
ncbi:breast cancer anti-estrogen resistance protein 1 isoform X1 [Drosophila bipectinata]|uniref:breast cancer anti-estrogen resistance protein 1 isoform X1 n=2 Tax=Drosophila bipectinata TaxID=42026 RepID=UPI001C8AF618|nr:breast cancer anti-estrogen resistance protein 1 isoform X1 [Drosophila bipectinata]